MVCLKPNILELVNSGIPDILNRYLRLHRLPAERAPVPRWAPWYVFWKRESLSLASSPMVCSTVRCSTGAYQYGARTRTLTKLTKSSMTFETRRQKFQSLFTGLIMKDGTWSLLKSSGSWYGQIENHTTRNIQKTNLLTHSHVLCIQSREEYDRKKPLPRTLGTVRNRKLHLEER